MRSSTSRAVVLVFILVALATSVGRADEPGKSTAPPVSSPAGPTLAIARVDRATARVLTMMGPDAHLVRGDHRKNWFAFPRMGLGSALAVSNDGLFFTAAHVVEGALAVFVKVPEDEAPYPATVVYRDEDRDVALLSVDAATPFWVLPEAPSAPLAIRQVVHAIGYPMDPTRALPQSSQGILAGILPDGRLQLGIAVNPGNSGGPLIDDQNRLIGMVVARADPSVMQGIAAAVPVDSMIRVHRAHVGVHRQHGEVGDPSEAELLLEASSSLIGFAEPRGERLALSDDAWQRMSTLRQRKLGERLERAMRASRTMDPLFAVALAMYEWNLSALCEEHGDPAARQYREHSARLVHGATTKAPHLLASSRFLRLARRRAEVDHGLPPARR